jgi:hypothetical protein
MGSSESNNSSWMALKAWWVRREWPVIGLLLILFIVLGFWGFEKHFAALNKHVPFWYKVYLSLQLVTMESGNIIAPIDWELDLARFLVPLVAGYTVVRTIFALLREQFEMLRLRRTRNHTVVCGLGKKGLLLTKSLFEKGEQVIAIEKDEDNPNIETCRQLNVRVLVGDATDKEILRKAGIKRAKSLVAVCREDGSNAEIAVHARGFMSDSSQSLNSVIHIYEPHLCNDLRRQEMLTEKQDRMNVEYFNVFEAGATALLRQFFVLDRSDASLLIVGAGKLGESLILRAARGWKAKYKESNRKLPITIVDQFASERLDSITSRYPYLSEVCRLQAECMDVQSGKFYRGEFLWEEPDRCCFTCILVCLDNDALSLSSGMVLHRKTKRHVVDVIVRMTANSGLVTLLEQTDDLTKNPGRIHAFTLLDRTCTADTIYNGSRESIARAIHAEYVRNLKSQNQTAETNPSIVDWEALPGQLKESNRLQADDVGAKLKSVRCDIETLTDWDAENFEFRTHELEHLAMMEHERFMKERNSKGWTYAEGPKNLEKKTSPYLIEWEKLPDDVKEFDRVAVRAIPALLADAGFQIYRPSR